MNKLLLLTCFSKLSFVWVLSINFHYTQTNFKNRPKVTLKPFLKSPLFSVVLEKLAEQDTYLNLNCTLETLLFMSVRTRLFPEIFSWFSSDLSRTFLYLFCPSSPQTWQLLGNRLVDYILPLCQDMLTLDNTTVANRTFNIHITLSLLFNCVKLMCAVIVDFFVVVVVVEV